MTATADWSSFASPLLSALPEAVLVLDDGGVIRYVNPAGADLLGHTPAELAGAPVGTVLVPQPGQRVDVVTWLQRWAADRNSPQMRFLTLTGRTRAGALLRLSVRVARLFDPRCYVVTLRDVTAENREHLDIKHAYLVVSRILAIADDAIVNLDAAQKVLFFNRKAEELFGYRSDEVLGKSVEMLLPQRFRGTHERHVAAFAQGPAPSRLMGQRGEIVGLTRAGVEFPLEASITKVFIEGVPTFSAHLRDIRARKAAQRALIESEQRFRTVFEHALEAMVLLEPDGTVIALNDATQRLLGDQPGAPGEKFWALQWWQSEQPAQTRENLRSTVARCAAGEDIRLRVELGSVETPRVVDFSLRAVTVDGEVTALLAEGRDITAIVGQ